MTVVLIGGKSDGETVPDSKRPDIRMAVFQPLMSIIAWDDSSMSGPMQEQERYVREEYRWKEKVLDVYIHESIDPMMALQKLTGFYAQKKNLASALERINTLERENRFLASALARRTKP